MRVLLNLWLVAHVLGFSYVGLLLLYVVWEMYPGEKWPEALGLAASCLSLALALFVFRSPVLTFFLWFFKEGKR